MAIEEAGRIPVAASRRPRGAAFLNNPRIRGIVIQVLLIAALLAFTGWIIHNTATNLQRANIASGFDFLEERAGFEIGQSPIPYTPDRSYGYALYVGFLNTLVVAGIGIAAATTIGFLVGIGRLSRNWLIRQLSTVYVEVFRNIPPLLVILFWYFGVIAVLPAPRDAIDTGIGISLSNRGAFMPRLLFEEGASLIGAAFILAVVIAAVLYVWANQRQLATGIRPPVLWPSLGLIVGLPALAYVVAGAPLGLEFPEQTRFSLRGGMQVQPEFLALVLALSIYTASFIAEIVRAGILAVSHGQTEAAYSLGFRSGLTLRLIVVPQAMRVIIPPLTSQYLNLTKNSSLAVAIGYADLVAVGGTILNQTGQAVEIVAIWMVVYLSISLITSLFMNWFNSRMALVER
ncbi:MAG TPA: amino acid ABC transporter permease [Reyranella sp.]|nr:amino acid ABC transporter permease [Reyranella sp.]